MKTTATEFGRSKLIAFSRWGNKCQLCDYKQHLTAHHVLHQPDYPEFVDEPWNIIPLCEKCHEQLHLAHDIDSNVKSMVLARMFAEVGGYS